MLEPLAPDSGLFRKLLDAAPDATVIVDSSATIVLVNRQVENVLGYPASELLGERVEVLVPERFRGVHPQHRDGFLAAPGTRHMGAGTELFALHHDGREIPVEISLSPLETERGLLVSASVRDITERRRMQEESTRMREELIATVSHELRTPLTSIIGYTELLGDLADDLQPRARELVSRIERNAARELRLVDDLLTMAFLDGERLRVSVAPTDLVAVAQRVVEDHRRRAAEAAVVLELVADGVAGAAGVPLVCGDAHRLLQVVENLVTNALKFTPAGGRVRVTVAADGDGVLLRVADTGVGVAAHELPRLFDRLYRTPGAVAAQTQGAGLGLSIVQKIVEAHDGRIEVTSEVGTGTTMTVHLVAADERP